MDGRKEGRGRHTHTHTHTHTHREREREREGGEAVEEGRKEIRGRGRMKKEWPGMVVLAFNLSSQEAETSIPL